MKENILFRRESAGGGIAIFYIDLKLKFFADQSIT